MQHLCRECHKKHMRYEKIFLGGICCEKAPQVVRAWGRVGDTAAKKTEKNIKWQTEILNAVWIAQHCYLVYIIARPEWKMEKETHNIHVLYSKYGKYYFIWTQMNYFIIPQWGTKVGPTGKGEKRNKLFNQYCPCLPCFTVTTNIRNWTEPSSQLGESA